MPYVPYYKRQPEKPREPKHDFFDRITLGVAIVGVTVLAVAAGVSVWQAIIASRQQGIMQGQLTEMQAEQRANLWLGSNLGHPQFILEDPAHKTGQIVWSIHLQNYGKSFITSGTRDAYLRLGSEGFQKSFGVGQTILGVMAPNQDQFITVVSKPGYTADQATKFLSGDYGVVLRIESKYTDLSGAAYEASMCVETLHTGAIAFCKQANYIK